MQVDCEKDKISFNSDLVDFFSKCCESNKYDEEDLELIRTYLLIAQLLEEGLVLGRELREKIPNSDTMPTIFINTNFKKIENKIKGKS